MISYQSLLLSTSVLNDTRVHVHLQYAVIYNQKQPGCKKCKANQKQGYNYK